MSEHGTPTPMAYGLLAQFDTADKMVDAARKANSPKTWKEARRQPPSCLIPSHFPCVSAAPVVHFL